MRVLIIIVYYDNLKNLEECLRCLRGSNLGEFNSFRNFFDICVVDNSGVHRARRDFFQKMIDCVRDDLKIEIINSRGNLGFAGGVNVGLRMTKRKIYDWVWLLNPDCTVEIRGMLEEFIGIYGKRFDIWSPVVYDTAGKIWFAGGKINRVTGECQHQRTVRRWDSKTVAGETVKGKNNISKDIISWKTTWVSGCSMFVKPKVFEKIGFFDEKFFLFYEDVDFCLRAKAAGFRIGVSGLESVEGLKGIDRLKIIHKVSQSVNKLTNKYEIEMRSKFYLLKKHWSYFYPSAYLISKLRYLKHKVIKGI